MPFNTLVCNDFLTPVELNILAEVREVGDGVGAILVDKQKAKWGLYLNEWGMKKASGNGTMNYALICGWNDIVKGNELEIGSFISIWSFRLFGLLCFALVLPPPMD
ncbi:unnamed protein product [Microthlaspi erraticum]|uniref:TF-B3 domain-containing protein n=1 Tax=Microthlaspi erraticum TaxID=1685480 RepID=A0A6D2I9S4_9BRAS|nr:unnamed protein product [Microthlaspi erraticum]